MLLEEQGAKLRVLEGIRSSGINAETDGNNGDYDYIIEMITGLSVSMLSYCEILSFHNCTIIRISVATSRRPLRPSQPDQRSLQKGVWHRTV